MSEVDLTVLAFRAKANDEKTPTPMQEINEVLKTCKFGRFHVKVLCSSFFGVLTAVLISNTIPYVLPIAECDLNMNLLQKGILNAMPFFGMLVSSILAGFLTDTFGRKIFLLIGYGGITVFNLVSAMSQTYVMLITSKFFEGLLFAAAFNPTMTYTSECCYSNIRDRMMLCQSSFQTFGQFLLAFLSWGLLTQDWRYNFFDGAIVINSWNIYLLVVTVCPLSACILYGLLPESPKFLISQHRYEEARAILIRIYVSNTGKPRDTFPYKDLWKDKEKQIKDETRERNVESTLKHNLVIGLHNVKPLFKKPLLPYLALFCLMNFLIMFLYNTIRLWFPQLSTIVEHYSNNEETNQDLCVMLDSYTHDLRMRNAVNSTIQEICVPTKSGAETYINSIILGLACLLPYIISGLLVNKVGKKSILMVAGVITIGATLGLRWSRSKTEVVALFAATMAASQAMMSLLQATTVEVFPTTTRTLAISMTMTSGRLGTLVGNITFPILLNMGCAVPLFTMAGVMISVTSMTIFLPKKK